MSHCQIRLLLRSDPFQTAADKQLKDGSDLGLCNIYLNCCKICVMSMGSCTENLGAI